MDQDNYLTEMQRNLITDRYINRVIDNMSIAELCQFMYDKLREELQELDDRMLESAVAEYASDILDEVMFPTIEEN